MKLNVKKPLIFTAILLPIAIIAGLFTGNYSYSTYSVEVQNMIIEQIGSYELFILIIMLQSVWYTFICGFIGYIISEKVGLLKSFKIKINKLAKSSLLALICGMLFSLDYWVFGKFIPDVAKAYEAKITVSNFMSSVLYGGIIEEIMLRLFVMSLFSFILWKLFFRKFSKEEIPNKVFIVSNILSAILFAILHLPATFVTFETINALVIFRCFLLNGGLGIVFGWLYQKYGIQYAMIGHMGCHIVSKIIWLIFI